jgi:hypothetical protein
LHHLRRFISVHFRLLSVVLIPVVVFHHIVIIAIVIIIQGKVVLVEACSGRTPAALLSSLVEVYMGENKTTQKTYSSFKSDLNLNFYENA